MELSDKENELYEFIKALDKENGVTVKEIEEALGANSVGGIGKLLKEEKIWKKKLKTTDDYNTKSVFHYKVKSDV